MNNTDGLLIVMDKPSSLEEALSVARDDTFARTTSSGAAIKLRMERAKLTDCGEYAGRKCFIYFIWGQTTKLIKIGRALCVVRRLAELQGGSPDRLSVAWLYQAPPEHETELHARFRDSHSHGEWFWPSEKLVTFIRNGRAPPERWLRRREAA